MSQPKVRPGNLVAGIPQLDGRLAATNRCNALLQAIAPGEDIGVRELMAQARCSYSTACKALHVAVEARDMVRCVGPGGVRYGRVRT